MSVKPVKIGIVGCGNISGIYCQNAGKLEAIELAACADLIPERAEATAAEHGVPKACSTEELLADPEVEIVLNLTIPIFTGFTDILSLPFSPAACRYLAAQSIPRSTMVFASGTPKSLATWPREV